MGNASGRLHPGSEQCDSRREWKFTFRRSGPYLVSFWQTSRVHLGPAVPSTAKKETPLHPPIWTETRGSWKTSKKVQNFKSVEGERKKLYSRLLPSTKTQGQHSCDGKTRTDIVSGLSERSAASGACELGQRSESSSSGRRWDGQGAAALPGVTIRGRPLGITREGEGRSGGRKCDSEWPWPESASQR